MENDKKEGLGFSQVINAKEYRRTIKYVAVVVCALIAIVGVGAFFFSRSEGITTVDITQMAIAGVIIAVSVVVAFLRISGRGSNRGWIGEIIDKRIMQEGDNTYYMLDVLKDDGSKDSLMCSEKMFAYYSVGDKIKRHAGYDYWEKFDKRDDHEIICIRCGRFTNIDKERCHSCNLPLLK